MPWWGWLIIAVLLAGLLTGLAWLGWFLASLAKALRGER